jgi:hypothetical protein
MKSPPKSPLDSSPLQRGAGRGEECLEGSGSKPERFEARAVLLREQTRRRRDREGQNKLRPLTKGEGEKAGVEIVFYSTILD